jgi:Ca2+-binding EF-hand superfamily protein
MNIRENIQSDMDASAATNALEKTKKEISTFFDYLDCNDDGFISAENMYMGMKNMKKM